MLKLIRWDVYTIIIVALIPTFLGTAWALSEWEENRLHKEQCAIAREWLESSENIISHFEDADSMEDIDLWISEFEGFNSPAKAGQLRWGILSSARYHADYYPDESTSVGGVLNPPNGLFSRDITEGTEELVEHCPETLSMLPGAFPMVFTEEPEVED